MDILKLSTCEPCQFEPVGSVTNVFFDDRCQQVSSTTSPHKLLMKKIYQKYPTCPKVAPSNIYYKFLSYVQVFSVRSGGATGIVVRGFSDSKCSTFRTEDQGPIISIKLSPDQKVLGLYI